MNNKNRRQSLLVFLITGVGGILGIGCKEKIITFYRKQANQKQVSTKLECLDFVEAAHSDRIYPLIHCHFKTDGKLNIEKLKIAVGTSAQYVPEIFYSLDIKKYAFIDCGYDVEDVFIKSTNSVNEDFSWDLSNDTQIKIVIYQNNMTISMSHILTDGNGFIQYLYLLSAIYNGDTLPNTKNVRDISFILKDVHVQAVTEQMKNCRNNIAVPLRGFSTEKNYLCLNSIIDADDFELMKGKAKKQGVTLNDIFLTAYARTIADLQHKKCITFPCPADLRRFSNAQDMLTIANMTGNFKKICIEIEPSHPFNSTLRQVNLEMILQKSRYRCFEGIKFFHYIFRKIPMPILRLMVKKTYKISPVSYTNIGIINDEKFKFNGCTIMNCYITGTYRKSPDFQLSISTFRNVCNLNCTVMGNDASKSVCQNILTMVKKELLNWANSQP